MALEPVIQIQDEPENIEMVYGYNVWTLSDLNTTNPRYVLQVWNWNDSTESADELLFDLRQQSNPAGFAHFDIQKILQNLVEHQYRYVPPFQFDDTTASPGELRPDFTYSIKAGYENTAGVPVIQQESGPKVIYPGYKKYNEVNFDISPFRPVFNPTNEFGQITLVQSARPFAEWWDAYPSDASGTWPYKVIPVTEDQPIQIPILTNIEIQYDPDSIFVT